MLELTLNGLAVKWDAEKRVLYFGTDAGAVKPAIRCLGDMEEVLYAGGGEPEEKIKNREELQRELYFMFRDLSLPEHRSLFREKGIRYDITVLASGTIGREYVKTAGHYHPLKPGTPYTYPEVYEVIYGEAHYLLQEPVDPASPEKGLREIIIVAAGPGDKVLIPSGYGHVTINPGSGYLIMSNLVAGNFDSVYEPLREMGGAGYCQLCSPEDGPDPLFVTNTCYSFCPPLHFLRPIGFEPLLPEKSASMYHAFIKCPHNFAYLTSPEDFQEEFKQYLEAVKRNSFNGCPDP